MLDRDVTEVLRLLLAKEIDDAVLGHAIKPTGNVVDGHQQTVGFDELIKNVLQDVFSVFAICDPAADEIAQPGFIASDRFGDLLVLLRHQPPFAKHRVHLVRKTNEREKYCMGKLMEITPLQTPHQ